MQKYVQRTNFKGCIYKKVTVGQIINSESLDNVDREPSAFEQTMREYMERRKNRDRLLTVHPLEVDRAFGYLKRNKAAGPDMIETEHLQYGGRSLAIYT